ncbi:MAG: hypothetical protein LBU88_05560 [Treponema sp.]|jgi:hypothetical protein|nr:hypothetical protein [Treponema sp.]
MKSKKLAVRGKAYPERQTTKSTKSNYIINEKRRCVNPPPYLSALKAPKINAMTANAARRGI